jgi:RNA polymerase primary sigma factor
MRRHPFTPVGRPPGVRPDELFHRDAFRTPVLDRDETRRLLREVAALGPVTTVGRARRRAIPPEDRPRFEELRNRLVLGHLRLCAAAVHRGRWARRCRSLTAADLIHEAVFGLMRAVELFDPDRGTAFSTDAYHRIRQAVARAAAGRDGLIRVPRYRVSGPERLSGPALGRFAAYRRVESLGRQLVDPRATDPADEVAEREAVRGRDRVVAAVVRELPGRAADVVRKRFGLDGAGRVKLRELGAGYGLTRERVRQLEAQALDQLREPPLRANLEAVAPEGYRG